MFIECIGVIDHENLVAVVTNFPAVDIIELVVNDNGTDDQGDGNEKLKNDQTTS